MSIARVKASSLTQGLPKQKTMLAGNNTILPGSYESIQTVTVGAGGAATIDFNSIAGTYKHLQIRGIGRNNGTASNDIEGFLVRYNGATSGYSWHALQGDGSGTGASSGTSQTYMYGGYTPTNGSTANAFSTFVIDILDYSDTNKNKTQRVLTGFDTNVAGNGRVGLWSGLYQSTSAVTSITLYSTGSRNFTQYSTFALYGIK
jgi:hypothetical protein